MALDHQGQDGSERRVHPRVAGDWLQCDLGEIIDVSATGIFLKCTRRLRGTVALRLCNFETGLVLQARVVWSNPVCFRHHEVGLQFQNVGQGNMKTLEELVYPLGEEAYLNYTPATDGHAETDLHLADEEDHAPGSNRLLDEFPSTDGATCIDDEALREIIDAWPHIPSPMQDAILNIVRNSAAAA